MPIISPILTELIKTKTNSKMANVGKYNGPLFQNDPSYFISMCSAIAKGITDGTKSINFATKDKGVSGLPFVGAPGIGKGIIVDSTYFEGAIYTNLRNMSIAEFGETSHDPYPPRPTNSGVYIQSIAGGIAESVKEHFSDVILLNSTHTTVYFGKGEIILGAFYGLNADAIKSLIISNAPNLKGSFWPKIAEAISNAYVDTIHNHSSGIIAINGVCVPNITQTCGIPFVGAGIGTAT